MKKASAEKVQAALNQFRTSNSSDDGICGAEAGEGVLRITLTMKRFLEQRKPSEYYLALLDEPCPRRRRRKGDNPAPAPEASGDEQPLKRKAPVYRPLQLPSDVPVEFEIAGEKKGYYLTASLDHYYSHNVPEKKPKEPEAEFRQRVLDARRGLAQSLEYELRDWSKQRNLAPGVVTICKVVYDGHLKPGAFIECTPEVMDELSKLMGIEKYEPGVLPKEPSEDDEY